MNIAKTFTFFTTDAWRNKYSNSEFVARNLLQAVQNNIISNPIYAYKLLKEIPRESVSTELYKDIVLEIANNPNANANDAAKYARFLKTPKEIREMITDWLNRADEALKPELDKDIKDFDAIQAIRNGYANGIDNMFGPLGDLTRTDPQEFAKTKELATMLDEEFDINKMIKVKSGNYIQQYKENASRFGLPARL
ncbi:MAG: hypothetical protein J5611_00100 [Alphaproteobacteria bacterium]|nr:hypothetical protein [Alphaproteobacteria bacterium]